MASPPLWFSMADRKECSWPFTTFVRTWVRIALLCTNVTSSLTRDARSVTSAVPRTPWGGMGEYRWGKLIVSKGQSIVIESKLEEAGIQVCVNRNAVDFYDQTIEGTQSIEVKVDPGTYDIGTYPKDGATGTVTISVR